MLELRLKPADCFLRQDYASINMKHPSMVVALGALYVGLMSPGSVPAQELVHAKDGSGVYGYKDTPKLPWCNYLVHDPDRPAPRRVEPGPAGVCSAPPSD